MATDVVPALNEMINKSFQTHVMRDRRALTVSRKIRDGTATLADAHTYAQSLGENLSKALTESLTEANLPNGTLYYNIAERTVIPSLENNHKLVNETAAQVQKILDKKSKIGLKNITADFPKSRVQGLIDKMTADDITLEDAVKWLGEPIVNNTESFFDDFISSNAKFRNEVGLKTTITRIAEAGCCKWCADKEGSWEYGDEPDDIYARHEFCRCTVTYKSDRQAQDVWSKRMWQTSDEDIARRRSSGDRPTMSVQERINQATALARDKVVADFKKQTGYSRRAASNITRNKDPDEVQAEINKIIERRKAIGR